MMRTLRRFSLHLLCVVFPLATLLHTLTAPHYWWALPIPVLVIASAGFFDRVAAPDRDQPAGELPTWLYDGTLYLMAAVQLINISAMLWVIGTRHLSVADLLVTTFVVGSCTGYGAVVVAHELVHRKGALSLQLARLLMLSALYEHFCTEHVRGHHKHVGTARDPATALHGERFVPYVLRTVPGQFKSAWQLERHRLRKASPVARWLQHRGLQGVVVGWSFVGLLVVVQPVLALAFVAQAAWAVIFLESVNYIEHWGLVRESGPITLHHSWDAESWFSLYTLVGLARHADHHAHASRPYQDLRHFEQSIKMPYGYWAMSLGAMFFNGHIIRRMDARLREASAGPYGDVVG